MATTTALTQVPWAALPSKPLFDAISNPKTLFDANHNAYVEALSAGAKQQKADMIERQYRMAAHAQNSETTRQLRILHSVQPNREPAQDELSGRQRPGWLGQVEAPRVSRPGDKAGPTRFPAPDDVGGREEDAKLRRRAEAAVGGRPAGTCRFKEGDLPDGVGEWASGRKPGELYPVLARSNYQFIQGESLDNPVAGPNRSTNTAASWRTAEKVRHDSRSTNMPVNFTGAPEHAGLHSRTGNLVVQPSMTLVSDDSGAFGDKHGTGGVSQTSRGGYERGTVRVTADQSLPLEQKPSFILVPKATAARDGTSVFRKDDDNFAKDLAYRNKLTDKNFGPRIRSDEYSFVDDGRCAVPVKANTTDVLPAAAQRGDMRVKSYDLPTTAEDYARGMNAGILQHQHSEPRKVYYRTSMQSEDLDAKMYLKSLGTGHTVLGTTERADIPQPVRYRRDGLDLEEQQRTAAQRGEDRRGGRELLDERDEYLHRQNVRVPEGADRLRGAHDQTLGGIAPPVTGQFKFSRNQPNADRELIRKEGTANTMRGQDIGFEIKHSNKDSVDMDMLQHSTNQLQPLNVIVDRTDLVPLGDSHDKHVDVNLMDRTIGAKVGSTRELLQSSTKALAFR